MPTIPISDVERGDLLPAISLDESIASLLAKPVEALECPTQRLVSCDTRHAFAKAAHDAFYLHHPLAIRPDDVWFCIAQGFAHHVKANADAFRERLVRHEGTKKLVVERLDFRLGEPNPWPEAFEAFSTQIGEQVGKLRDLVAARFGTTGPLERAAFDVCMMDGYQGYFEYEMMIGCGIPEVVLDGSPEDWGSMIPRVRHLSEYGLEEWTDALVPVLEELVKSARGDADREFWRSFFRHESGSGSNEMTGWIVTLFPYVIADWETGALGPSPHLAAWRERFEQAASRTSWYIDEVQGPQLGAIPQSLASAPVHLVDVRDGAAHDLRFVAGMFGVEQDDRTRALSPAFGWAVVHDPS